MSNIRKSLHIYHAKRARGYLLGVVLKIPVDGEPGSIFDNCDVVLVGVAVPVVPP